jgi:hypothetical protein
VIDLPTIQRYLNFHFSVTIDLFGADESSNAATFYSTGLKGRFEEGKRRTTTSCKGQTYKVLDVQNGRPAGREGSADAQRAQRGAARRLHQGQHGGVERWNKVIEKAGIPFRLKVPHKAFHRNIGALAGVKVSPDGRVVSDPSGTPRSTVAAQRRGPRLRRQPDGPRGGARQVRQLDRAAGHGHQPPAGGLRVRALATDPPPNRLRGLRPTMNAPCRCRRRSSSST